MLAVFNLLMAVGSSLGCAVTIYCAVRGFRLIRQTERLNDALFYLCVDAYLLRHWADDLLRIYATTPTPRPEPSRRWWQKGSE